MSTPSSSDQVDGGETADFGRGNVKPPLLEGGALDGLGGAPPEPALWLGAEARAARAAWAAWAA